MRLASYQFEGKQSYGIVTADDHIIDLSSRLGEKSLLELIESDNLELAQQAMSHAPDFSINEVVFNLPIIGGEKIICVGINYPEREEEYKGQLSRGDYPNLFVRFPSSFSAHNQPIIRPKVSTQFDYEGEVALVIGKAGRHITKEEALSHVVAVVPANEGTVRDWVKHGSRNVTQGKNFEHSGAIGPWIATTDELDLTNDLQVTTRVNGQVRQNDSTKNMFWSFEELINYISTFTTLLPGDIIFTGTPVGAGAHQTPPIYLEPGDVVEVEVAGMGTLRNTVEDEA